MAEFVNYRSFNDKAMAVELYEKLSRQGLPVQWEDTVGIFDASFANDEFMHLYYVKLRKEDFEKADKILLQSISESNERPAEDYYLFSFSNDELTDVLKKPDEWNEFDRYWAGKILEERGVQIKEDEITQEKIEYLNELKKPWELNKFWVFVSIVLLLFGVVILYAIVACLLMNLYIAYSKKTVPTTGERVQAFSDSDRSFAKIMIVISSIFLFAVSLLLINMIVDYPLIKFG